MAVVSGLGAAEVLGEKWERDDYGKQVLTAVVGIMPTLERILGSKRLMTGLSHYYPESGQDSP